MVDDLNLCVSLREALENDHWLEFGSACSNTEPDPSTIGSRGIVPGNSSISGPKPSPQSTMPSLNVDTRNGNDSISYNQVPLTDYQPKMCSSHRIQ